MNYSKPIEVNWPTFFLYTGLQTGSNGREHEFIITPTYMSVPCNDPIYTRLFSDGQLVMVSGKVLLDKSTWKNSYNIPNTADHKRLNDILVDYYKQH